MIKHPAWFGAAVLVGTLTLAACGSSSGPAAANTTPASAPTSTTSASSPPTTGGSNAGSDFCTEIKQARANFAAIGSTFAKSVQSGKFATVKQTLQAFFTAAGAELAKIESTMTSAPANVQAALVSVNMYYARISAAINQSTGLAQLGASMVAASKQDSQLKAASATLNAWGVSQCGGV